MFSGAVKLLDLNDYIKPGEECIVLKPPTNGAKGKVELLFDGPKAQANLIKPKGDKATLSLADCLACVGCVTTAEALLVEEQSISALLSKHAAFSFKCLLVSAQSLAALAVHWELSLEAAFGLITAYFTQQLGFAAVFDIAAFVHLAQLRATQEFNLWAANSPAARTLMCSECPGWVCYLEKVLGDRFVSLASREKPPQLVQAESLKNFISAHLNVARRDAFVVLLAPCFDKKLEASREEMREGLAVLDLVVATEEVRQLMAPLVPQLRQQSPTQLQVTDSYRLCDALLSGERWQTIPLSELVLRRCYRRFGSSNGYADAILHSTLPDATVSVVQRRGDNFVELTAHSGDAKLVFALVYGFKNIQNLVREIKSGKVRYDYAEVMACPGGCAGGGAQIPNQSAERVSALMDTALLPTKQQAELVSRLAAGSEHIAPPFFAYPIAAVAPAEGAKISW